MQVKRNFIYDPSLVLYLPLHELDGSSFMSRDACGHLVAVTGALWQPYGRYFDGVDDIITIPDQANLKFGLSNFSILLWAKAASNGTALLGKYSYPALYRGYQIHWSGTGAGIYLVYSASRYIYRYTASASETGWNCFVFAIDRSASLITCYLNGQVNQGSQTTYGGFSSSSNISTTKDLTIAYSEALANKFHGDIGEVRVYRQALSPEEVQQNYLATKWRYQ